LCGLHAVGAKLGGELLLGANGAPVEYLSDELATACLVHDAYIFPFGIEMSRPGLPRPRGSKARTTPQVEGPHDPIGRWLARLPRPKTRSSPQAEGPHIPTGQTPAPLHRPKA